jgi:DNA helicase-2/ATP-dependent DNA helicase PcrA
MNEPAQKIYSLKAPARQISRNITIDYQSELNPSQYEAVTTTGGQVLCIAGAGSGKTRTLIYRVAYLIEQNVEPEKILLLTFTRKAAGEMLRRATSILDDRCKRIRGGTFHGFANSLLRKYSNQANLPPNFTILDRGDSEDLLNLVRTEKGYAKSEDKFPKKNTCIDIFSKSINTSKTIAEVIDKEYPQFGELASNLERLQEDYQIYKRERGVLDYDDLLVELKLLLTLKPETLNQISQQFKYIMVDEYQDTNRIQSEISYLLASYHKNLLVVGDDAQSIYSFRGAEFRNIMDFPIVFPSCKIITLEQNYRSTQPILEFSNALLDTAKEKYPKRLFSDIEASQKPVFLRPLDANEQSYFITQRILELREEGIPFSEMAILFRAAWHSNELEIELNSRGIPFQKFGGLKFVESAHVKDIMSILRVVKNHRDSISWHRALLMLEGVGPKTALDISTLIIKNGGHEKALNVPKSKKYHKDLENLSQTVSNGIDLIGSPEKLMDLVISYYTPILRANYDDYNKRVDDINSLKTLAERYQDLASFMDDMTLEAPDQTQIGTEAESKENERVTLSTIHSAKGLEWHTVFIISTNDGYIPSSRALSNDKEIEEERRLFYVACTRAKRNLYILSPEHIRGRGYSSNAGAFSFSDPSRFIWQIENFSRLTESWALEGELNLW